VLLAWVKISASYRTDTTKTVLSAPEEKSGRHSGSGLSTEVQGPAHGQLRDIVMGVLLELETAEGGTELSMRILLVAVAAASQAQLNLAKFVKRGIGVSERHLGNLYPGAGWQCHKEDSERLFQVYFTCRETTYDALHSILRR
jgi:hypothetical protein